MMVIRKCCEKEQLIRTLTMATSVWILVDVNGPAAAFELPGKIRFYLSLFVDLFIKDRPFSYSNISHGRFLV